MPGIAAIRFIAPDTNHGIEPLEKKKLSSRIRFLSLLTHIRANRIDFFYRRVGDNELPVALVQVEPPGKTLKMYGRVVRADWLMIRHDKTNGSQQLDRRNHQPNTYSQ